ncbi:hypothetical protein GCM10017673_47710 [Streptosporangium violaceochromogenes]|nr:hypothetical protein GCM10017673_47710 [Streptosporangium violaceochromogenes]
MRHPEPPPTEPVIPGWRVMRSDAGRYWASREKPFDDDGEWYDPPFRTVDGDTFEQLRAETERQEEVARTRARESVREAVTAEGTAP